MKALKVLSITLVSTVLLYLFLVNFSAAESRYECSGTITINGAEDSATTFLRLQRYRWWVGLWSDSSGSAWVELPNQSVSYFSHLTEGANIIQLWATPSKFSGTFSTLSGSLGVEIGALGVFEGTCQDIRQ